MKYINENHRTEMLGREIGIFARFFGCWHFKLSRPMTISQETYCVCAKCGARIRFDTANLTTTGKYYYPPINSLYPND